VSEPSERLWRTATAAILLVAGVLIFMRLGKPLLWQDEAQTALLARTVVQHGIPLGHDGANGLSQEGGAEYGPGLRWTWHPWLPFYVLAAFFRVAGESTFIARLPFAIFGWLTVLAAALLAGELFGSRRARAFAALVLAADVPFLVLSRQCRYYSLTTFLAILALWAYRRGVNGSRAAPYLLCALSVLLLHTHYVTFAAVVLTVIGDALWLHRGALARTILACAVATVCAGSLLAFTAGMPYGKRYELLGMTKIGEFLASFSGQLLHYVFTWPLIAGLFVFAVMALVRYEPRPSEALVLPVLFVVVNVVLFAVAAYAPFFRNLAAVIPVCAVLVGRAADVAWQRRPLLGSGLLALAIAGQPLGSFAGELTHDFVGPLEGLVPYLNANGRDGDVVAVTYEDLPLKLYTRMRVVGGLTGEDLGPALAARWIVLRQYTITEEDARVAEFLKAHIWWPLYENVTLSAPDTPWENRESPQEHLYRTAEGEPPVVVFKRTSPP
jgi:4-amino-4-deoxy-L-arabinose transferase-like glycosyltransferase